jgi:hypothetical protein
MANILLVWGGDGDGGDCVSDVRLRVSCGGILQIGLTEQNKTKSVDNISRSSAADLFFIEVSPGVTKTHVGKPSN